MKQLNRDDIVDSKIYQRVLRHRGMCEYWKTNKYCPLCEGGGLQAFSENLLKEFGLWRE